jgi:hypothetical protein
MAGGDVEHHAPRLRITHLLRVGASLLCSVSPMGRIVHQLVWHRRIGAPFRRSSRLLLRAERDRLNAQPAQPVGRARCGALLPLPPLRCAGADAEPVRLRAEAAVSAVERPPRGRRPVPSARRPPRGRSLLRLVKGPRSRRRKALRRDWTETNRAKAARRPMSASGRRAGPRSSSRYFRPVAPNRLRSPPRPIHSDRPRWGLTEP